MSAGLPFRTLVENIAPAIASQLAVAIDANRMRMIPDYLRTAPFQSASSQDCRPSVERREKVVRDVCLARSKFSCRLVPTDGAAGWRRRRHRLRLWWRGLFFRLLDFGCWIKRLQDFGFSWTTSYNYFFFLGLNGRFARFSSAGFLLLSRLRLRNL